MFVFLRWVGGGSGADETPVAPCAAAADVPHVSSRGETWRRGVSRGVSGTGAGGGRKV